MTKIKNFGPAKIDTDFDGASLEPREELGKEFIRQFRKAIWVKNSTKVGEY